MQFGFWALILPALQLASAAWLVYRVHWRRYPALLAYLVGDAAAIAANVLLAQDWITGWLSSQPLRMVLRASLCCEILWTGCVRLKPAQRARAIVTMTAAALAAGTLLTLAVGYAPWDSFLVFRQFFHLELAAVVCALTVHLRRNPIVENAEHRAYRVIGSLILVRIAIAGMFVRSGFGYLIFPYSRTTWQVADALSWVSAAVLLVLLAWRMTCTFSSRTPDKAFAGTVWC